MYATADEHGAVCDIVDLDGEKILGVVWANEESGWIGVREGRNVVARKAEFRLVWDLPPGVKPW